MNLFGEDEFEDVITIDAVPDHSGLKPPQASSILLGHEAIEQDILHLWQSGKMPHALVLNGLKGIGKATFAYRLARFILRETSEKTDSLFGGNVTADTLYVSADDPAFLHIASGGHTDLMVVSRPFDEKKGDYKNEIPVDDIRKVTSFLRKTSGAGGWRVVIIDDANMMNRSGQNALLKILEEPPKNTLLILVTHGAGGLIPTIRSRCRFVTFPPLENNVLNALFDMESVTPLMPADRDLITAMAQGSAGQGIQILQNGEIAMIAEILACLNDIADMGADALDHYALQFGKAGTRQGVDLFLYTLRWWFDVVISLCVEGQAGSRIGTFEIKRARARGLQDWLGLQESVEEHIKSCQSGNLDTRYMIFKILRMIQNG